jgi:hypothetical protein
MVGKSTGGIQVGNGVKKVNKNEELIVNKLMEQIKGERISEKQSRNLQQ